jgi:hypothetical protein
MNNEDELTELNVKIPAGMPPTCWNLDCKPSQMPMLLAMLFFGLGMLGGWFIVDDVIFVLVDKGLFEPICLFGVHFHHLYIGIIVTLIMIPVTIHEFKQSRIKFLIAMLILGIGFGLILSDIFSHFILVIDPFQFFC